VVTAVKDFDICEICLWMMAAPFSGGDRSEGPTIDFDGIFGSHVASAFFLQVVFGRFARILGWLQFAGSDQN
jgi:hypothetical protein